MKLLSARFELLFFLSPAPLSREKEREGGRGEGGSGRHGELNRVEDHAGSAFEYGVSPKEHRDRD